MLYRLFSDPSSFDLMSYLTSVLYMMPAMLIGLSFHEFAHAWAAVKMGDNTPRFMGRLTLDPFRHIDILGALCLLIAGYGWAKPVMINPRNFKNYRKGEIVVSLAGVTMNFLLAVLFSFLYVLLTYLGVQSPVLFTVLQYIIMINLSLMAFNLLPVPPFDGYHVVKAVAGHKLSSLFSKLERYGTIVLIIVLVSGVARWIVATVGSALVTFLIGLFGRLFGLL